MIVLRDVTKTYRMKVGRARVREMIPPPLDEVPKRIFPRWWTKDTFNALDGVSISIPSAASVGIVGHNGAGKTTLLKVVSGVTAPTQGSVKVRGRIAALIDLLVGFNPELTGRENAYFLASVHGVGHRSLNHLIDQILDFAEISGELVDTPLKRYSAGMTARLGFAVVTALEADIVLVDEVLAAGDSAFQQKCTRWLDEYRAHGGTLVFVSHNLALVRSMTNHVIWMKQGQVVEEGPPESVLAHYAQAMEHRDDGGSTHRRADATRLLSRSGLRRWGAGGIRVREVRFEEDAVVDGSGVGLTLTYSADAAGPTIFWVGFLDEGGRPIGGAASAEVAVKQGDGVIRCDMRPTPLRKGVYFPVVSILSADGVVRDHWQLERALVVDEAGTIDPAAFGPVSIGATWTSD